MEPQQKRMRSARAPPRAPPPYYGWSHPSYGQQYRQPHSGWSERLPNHPPVAPPYGWTPHPSHVSGPRHYPPYGWSQHAAYPPPRGGGPAPRGHAPPPPMPSVREPPPRHPPVPGAPARPPETRVPGATPLPPPAGEARGPESESASASEPRPPDEEAQPPAEGLGTPRAPGAPPDPHTRTHMQAPHPVAYGWSHPANVGMGGYGPPPPPQTRSERKLEGELRWLQQELPKRDLYIDKLKQELRAAEREVELLRNAQAKARKVAQTRTNRNVLRARILRGRGAAWTLKDGTKVPIITEDVDPIILETIVDFCVRSKSKGIQQRYRLLNDFFLALWAGHFAKKLAPDVVKLSLQDTGTSAALDADELPPDDADDQDVDSDAPVEPAPDDVDDDDADSLNYASDDGRPQAEEEPTANSNANEDGGDAGGDDDGDVN